MISISGRREVLSCHRRRVPNGIAMQTPHKSIKLSHDTQSSRCNGALTLQTMLWQLFEPLTFSSLRSRARSLELAGQVNQVEVKSLEIRGHSGLLPLSTAVKLSSEFQLGQ